MQRLVLGALLALATAGAARGAPRPYADHVYATAVPHSDADGQRQPPDRYFEHHVKLLLDHPLDVERVTAIARDHAAHVSRNALRTREDGREERFVTQRCYRVGRETAQRRMTELIDAMKAAGHHVLEAEAEFVVYDGNLSLDAGWLDEESGQRP